MKKCNKTIALLFVLVMCMMLMPLTAMAATNTIGVTFAATLDKATVDTGAEAQQVVMTVKANKEFETDGIGLKVLIPEGWTLAAIENADLQIPEGEINLAEGLVSYSTPDAENWSTDLIVKVTYNVPANVAAGTYTLGIQNLTLSKDFGTEWESEGSASVTLTVNGAAHTCQHDHYDTTETTHKSVCACGQTIGEATDHTGGTATCNAKAKCATCGAEYGNVDKTNHVGETELRNAATASCDKPGYTGDTYCKSCNELITKGEETPATGKHVDADGAWESDGVNHFHTCGCGAKFDEGKHTGGKATCMSGATCESCGLNYGELDPKNHAGDIIQNEQVTKEPTCGEPGKKTVTDSCDKCMVPVNEKEVEIPATGKHAGTYRFTWDWDANHNECTLVVWFHCNTCNNDIAFKNAKDAGVVTKVATCKETGIRTYTFDLSGAELPGNCTWDDFVLLNNDLGDENASWNYQTKVMTLNVVLPIDPNNHVGETEIRGAVKETCGESGYTGDTHCKDCGAKIAEGKPVEPTGDHKGGTATCTEKAICEVCGKEYGEKDRENHNWNQKWYQDEKVHWHECDDCHEGKDMGEHRDNNGDKKCDECGYIFGSVPGTGETPVVGIAVAVMFVAGCGAVLVFKKRKTVY